MVSLRGEPWCGPASLGPCFCPQISSSASAWKATTCRLGENEQTLEPNKTGLISHFHH